MREELIKQLQTEEDDGVALLFGKLIDLYYNSNFEEKPTFENEELEYLFELFKLTCLTDTLKTTNSEDNFFKKVKLEIKTTLDKIMLLKPEGNLFNEF